ncbi:lysine biosynthesis protein LysX [Candidatus Gottesmanbacteria bacterium]|nr:lysine biosynthesis protein LysX [Candidatus Gottesmanbacteria bacterium]
MIKKRKIRMGLLHTTIRGDEKLLINAATYRNVDLKTVDIREQILDPIDYHSDFDVILDRCVSTIKGIHAIEFFEGIGIPVVNRLEVARICENKFAASLVLIKHHVPTPRFALMFGEEQAKVAVDRIGGFPVVLKPISGSWGRLLARINDIHALEAVIEQKTTLGGPHHHVLYLQEYMEKPGRDIRINVIGGKVVAAIYRQSDHWITNTARGATAITCPIDRRLKDIALKAACAVGGGVLGIDIFETKAGYMVNEVNHTTEFKNVQRVTGIDVAGAIIDYCLTVVKK